jgi:UDP-glucose 4-epimerase
MKSLVTGGAGFIGSNIVEELVKLGHDVTVLDDFSLGRQNNLSAVKDKINTFKGDVRDLDLMKQLTKDVDFVFHQAAASSSPMFMKDLKNAFSVNIDGFINILNASRESGVKKVIYASTSSLYGNNPVPLREDMKIIPPNFYSASKLASEHLASIFSNEYGLNIIGLRYMSIYGPHEKSKGGFANLVSQFLWAMLKSEQPVIYGDGKQTRDFTFVADVVQANILVMNSKIKNDVFNVGTGKAISLNGLVDIINKLLKKNIKPKYIEMPVKSYIRNQLANITKIKKAIGYSPKYNLEDGIKITFERK